VRGTEIALRHDGRTANVVMEPGSFDAIVTHLLDNAVEAAAGLGPVSVSIRHDPLSVTIDIADSGPGMSPEFIRDTLFMPFASTKRGGHGIGAYQARELLREAGGDLLVISRRDVGTTMRLLLPSVAAAVQEPSPASA
jgi:signal transduction histidine kinase